MQLFAAPPPARRVDGPARVRVTAPGQPPAHGRLGRFTPSVDERTLDVFRRATDPADPFELRDLWLGRVEHEMGTPHPSRAWQAERWRGSTVRRDITAADVLSARATAGFVKELFNWFFRDDLYGEFRQDARVLLSGGSVDEHQWGLPEAIKDCLRYALDRDWYGYSDSCGRMPVREAVAAYESARIRGAAYTGANIALTMGGTSAVSTLADFVLSTGRTASSPALCATPNYPPLVEAVARRGPTRLVPLPCEDGVMSLEPLIGALRADTPLVLLQTAANPTGAAVDEAQLTRLIEAASPETVILLDECHEWLGDDRPAAALRAAGNVVRVSSLSKNWSAPGIKAGWIAADARLIEEYYEYASTHFGGPPSFFYTAVEMIARMERWLITGVHSVGPSELGEFEPSYGLDLPGLQRAYDSYCRDRRTRDADLRALRAATGEEMAEVAAVADARYSINTMVRFEQWDDSYRCFRELLRHSGVSVYPGILNFCFSGGVVRLTTARPWGELSEAFTRIRTAVGEREVARV